MRADTDHSKNRLWTQRSLLEGVDEIASRVLESISGTSPFCIWLDAEMGAGKTTFARSFFYALGLDSQTPVNSPTYTYIHEYELESGLYAHIDMYWASADMHWDELGCADVRDFKGILIEWPQRLVSSSFTRPTHRLEISTLSPEEREYRFFLSE